MAADYRDMPAGTHLGSFEPVQCTCDRKRPFTRCRGPCPPWRPSPHLYGKVATRLVRTAAKHPGLVRQTALVTRSFTHSFDARGMEPILFAHDGPPASSSNQFPIWYIRWLRSPECEEERAAQTPKPTEVSSRSLSLSLSVHKPRR